MPDTQTDIPLIRRFDVTTGGGRRHMVLLRSLLGRDHNSDGSYQEIAEVGGRLSSNADEDRKKPFA